MAWHLITLHVFRNFAKTNTSHFAVVHLHIGVTSSCEMTTSSVVVLGVDLGFRRKRSKHGQAAALP